MADRAVFLDRDNTIIDNDGYLGDPTKVKLLTGAATALSALRAMGYRLIVVSNQSGVARGMFNEAAVEAVNLEMGRQLRENANVHIDASYYCPFHPEAVIEEYKADHEWRKPKSGMILQAAADFNLDLSQCWTIGDMPRDIAAGAGAGTRTILLKDPDRPAPANPSNALDVSPNFVVRSLADAARIISREGKNPPPVQPTTTATPVPADKAALGAAPATPPISPAQTAVAAASSPSGIDESSLAEKITQNLARHPGLVQPAGSTKLERSLDELIVQIRQQNRNADLMPEFSMAKLAALILQVIAIICLCAGLYSMFTAPATFPTNLAAVQAITSLQRGCIWMMLAVLLQGAVISLLLASRRK